jgi:3'-phosphoadenosine 5'-phosphosulfate sulfotransferase (PAPS reductase)/FAD synthetase
MKIVSFGGGVQSTAMAILAAQGKIEVDAFVFCDTGFEQSIVFEFLEQHTKPLLEKSKIPFYKAKTEDYATKDFANFEFELLLAGC